MTIHITAVKFGGFGTPTITVYLNGTETAWIGDGQSVDISAPAGENHLLFKAAFLKKEIHFSSSLDVNISLKWNRLTKGLHILCTGADVKVLEE
jgi:hypothetical protein